MILTLVDANDETLLKDDSDYGFVLVNLVVLGLQYWRSHHSVEMKPRYPGMGGPAIEAFDVRTEKWIKEMQGDSLETNLKFLNDIMEYTYTKAGLGGSGGFMVSQFDSAVREKCVYQYDVDNILGNRRFRKVLEELKKVPKKKAVKLLTSGIRGNLEAMRLMYVQMAERTNKGEYKGKNYAKVIAITDDTYYRPRSLPTHPPTKLARRYAIFAYILLAAQLELEEVHSAIEDVIHLAKDEFKLFCSIDDVSDTFDYRMLMLEESLYHPSILVTAAVMCNSKTNQNQDTQKRLADKFVIRSIVDYRARTTEYDMPGAEGWCPIEPYEAMLPIRYYKEITDDEFNTVCP